jgi:hypothetical protein
MVTFATFATVGTLFGMVGMYKFRSDLKFKIMLKLVFKQRIIKPIRECLRELPHKCCWCCVKEKKKVTTLEDTDDDFYKSSNRYVTVYLSIVDFTENLQFHRVNPEFMNIARQRYGVIAKKNYKITVDPETDQVVANIPHIGMRVADMKRERDKRLIGKFGNKERKQKLEQHNELVKKWQEEAEIRA